MSNYLSRLGAGVAAAWNSFWFSPADAYTLGVIRLLVGAIALYLHLALTFDLSNFFAVDGLLPVDAVREIEQVYEDRAQDIAYGTLSYLNWCSSSSELLAAHLAGAAALVAMTIGWRSRVTAMLGFVVVLSNVHRAPMLTTACESVLTMTMAYLCLGPSGASWSVDARRAKRGDEAPRETSSVAANIALRLIQVHLAMLIAVMGFSKLIGDTETWWRGTGIWWLIARPDSRLIDLTSLHSMGYVVNLWTHAILAFEFLFPVLIWMPLLRPLLIGVGAAIWLSVALVTGDLPLALSMMAAVVAFIPGESLRRCCGCCPQWFG